MVDRAVRYLRKAQRPDGGFGQMSVSESNAQSTSFAIQGLAAAGRNPRKLKRTRTPIEYLKSLQAGDGSVRYSRTSAQTPVWVTSQALNALEVKPYPLSPASRQKAQTSAVAGADTPIQTRPVAQTTATNSPVTTSGDGEGSWWPFAFAAGLGVGILILLRLAWRRG